jgi:hypothetical protein
MSKITGPKIISPGRFCRPPKILAGIKRAGVGALARLAGHSPLGISTATLQRQSEVLRLQSALGTEVADRLLAHFSFQDGRFVSHHYPGGHRMDQLPGGTRKYFYQGQKASPLIIGSLADLSFYPVENVVHPDHGTEPRTLLFMEKYLLIPTKSGKLLFVSDAHTHAIFGWFLAKEIGLIGRNSALFHIDEHRDDQSPAIFSSREVPQTKRLEDIAALCQRHLDTCDFMDLGEDSGYSSSPGVFKEAALILTDFNGGNVDWFRHYDNGRYLSTRRLSLELVPKAIQTARSKGQRIIADIDLDYFAHYFEAGTSVDPETTALVSFEDNFRQVVEVARQSDFITIATSPDWFLGQAEHVQPLLTRLVEAL